MTGSIGGTRWKRHGTRCDSNGGAPGVDGETIEEIEATGESLERFLDEIQQSLQHQDLPAFGGTACMDSESQRKAQAAGHTDGAGPGGADGDAVDSGADL